MMTTTKIKEIIEGNLPDCTAVVENDANDGVHFAAKVVSSAFSGLPLVKQHQLVYGALGDLMKVEIHALQLKTFTPEKWAAQQG